MQNGVPVIVIGIRKEQGANVLRLTSEVREVVGRLNSNILKDNGLFIDWVNDQVPYIKTAISIVKNNVMVGGILAIIVLLLFFAFNQFYNYHCGGNTDISYWHVHIHVDF
jgi:HAE1 family hydrophobic/amphiphilic exporter-1